MTDELPVPILLARGVCRALAQRGYSTLTEFSLANGRRADVIGLGRGGELVIVEVKSSVQDFRSDGKWPEYREFCDRFYFAVPEGFPRDLIPEDCGLIMADRKGGEPQRLIAVEADEPHQLEEPGLGAFEIFIKNKSFESMGGEPGKIVGNEKPETDHDHHQASAIAHDRGGVLSARSGRGRGQRFFHWGEVAVALAHRLFSLVLRHHGHGCLMRCTIRRRIL